MLNYWLKEEKMKKHNLKSYIAATLVVAMMIAPVLSTSSTVNAANPTITELTPTCKNVRKPDGSVVYATFFDDDNGSHLAVIPRYSGNELKAGDTPALADIYFDCANYDNNYPDSIEYIPAADDKTLYHGSVKELMETHPGAVDGDISNAEIYIEGAPAEFGDNTYYLVEIAPNESGTSYESVKYPFTCTVTESGNSGTSTPSQNNSSVQNIYRLYNPSTGEHLYTSDANEEHTLVTSHGWRSENVGWIAPTASVPDVTPVYRLYNPGLDNHLYTSDTNEIRVLTSSQGWVMDNSGQPLFYSGGSFSIYRMYNRNANGLHLLTTDSNEYNTLPTHDPSWSQEGEKLKCISIG
jgi:hypothetical protein